MKLYYYSLSGQDRDDIFSENALFWRRHIRIPIDGSPSKTIQLYVVVGWVL